jgi:hypothetical protein
MPLNSDDEVRDGSFGGLSAFYGFNDRVLGASGGDAKAVAGDSDGLVMAGVDGKAEVAVLFGCLVRGHKGTEEGGRGDRSCVSDGDTAACGMIDGKDA